MKKSTIVFALAVCLVALFAVTAGPAMAHTDYGWYSPGYYAHHDWPYSPVYVAGTWYAQGPTQAFMLAPNKADKTYTMFNAVLAARLNDQGSTYPLINQGEAWLFLHPRGSGVTSNMDAWSGSGHGEVICNALMATFIW
jgi:hypothetical protein